MKLRKTTSVISAAVLACSGITALTSNAAYWVAFDADTTAERMSEEGFTAVGIIPGFEIQDGSPESYVYYLSSDGGRLAVSGRINDSFVFTTKNSSESAKEKIDNALAEAAGENPASCGIQEVEGEKVWMFHTCKLPEWFTNNDAREICEAVNATGELAEFYYCKDYYQTKIFDIDSTILNYSLDSKDIIEEYIKVSGKDNIYIAPEVYDRVGVRFKDETETAEILETAGDIFEKTGLSVILSYHDSTLVGSPYTKPIDVLNSTEGDANEDGKASIGDTVAVLQYIAAPDKYELTEQGKFNADLDCNGITAHDAYKIQCMDAEQ